MYRIRPQDGAPAFAEHADGIEGWLDGDIDLEDWQELEGWLDEFEDGDGV